MENFVPSYQNEDERRQIREEKDRNISFDTDIEAEKNDVTYVFNNNSKKFHYPSCHSVTEMKPKNREYFYGTRDEALALGYQPCGSCKP